MTPKLNKACLVSAVASIAMLYSFSVAAYSRGVAPDLLFFTIDCTSEISFIRWSTQAGKPTFGYVYTTETSSQQVDTIEFKIPGKRGKSGTWYFPFYLNRESGVQWAARLETRKGLWSNIVLANACP